MQDGAVGFLEEYHRRLLLVFLHAYFFCFLWSELFIFSVCSTFTCFKMLAYSLVQPNPSGLVKYTVLVIYSYYTTKKSSCPSIFFSAFLQTAIIDKPVPALFENNCYYEGSKPALYKALQQEAYSGVFQKHWYRKPKSARIGLLISLMERPIPALLKALEQGLPILALQKALGQGPSIQALQKRQYRSPKVLGQVTYSVFLVI